LAQPHLHTFEFTHKHDYYDYEYYKAYDDLHKNTIDVPPTVTRLKLSAAPSIINKLEVTNAITDLHLDFLRDPSGLADVDGSFTLDLPLVKLTLEGYIQISPQMLSSLPRSLKKLILIEVYVLPEFPWHEYIENLPSNLITFKFNTFTTDFHWTSSYSINILGKLPRSLLYLVWEENDYGVKFRDDMLAYLPQKLIGFMASNCQYITSTGIANLPRTLIWLNLVRARLTRDSLPYMPQSLRTLYLSGDNKITPEDVETLAPQIKTFRNVEAMIY
jgi:hypothetical protein